MDPHPNLLEITITDTPASPTTQTSLKISNADRTALLAQVTDPSTTPLNGSLAPASGRTPANTEIIRLTAVGSADSGGTGKATITITRNAETGGQTGHSVTAGDVIKFTITAKSLTDIENNLNAPIYSETPSGSINGSNTSFTLANTPISGSLQLYRDGQLLQGGSGNDYTISGATITMADAPLTGTILLAFYAKVAGGSGVNASTLAGKSQGSGASQIPALDANGHLNLNLLPIADGTLLNGKIVPSVTSNNLTVALKTLAGADPSTSDPVYIKINGTIYTITSALSVTKNAGTNWFNSGGTGLATNEIDYFVYLGYNTTDGVTIGFSRIPFGKIYSDFNTTTTNDNYCAISTITNATSSDPYVVIGRFASTLSAGAGYTWTVPTFTASNLVQRPIFETRWLNWSPSLTWTNAPTSLTTDARYIIEYRKCTYVYSIKGTANASNAGTDVYISPPITLATYTTASKIPLISSRCFWTDNASFTETATGYIFGGSTILAGFPTTTRKPTELEWGGIFRI